ncbi:MAG: plasmid recombination protein [Oscillospiraceae bacterium]|nr:plasmid recombination protein [Oscillospiraceae bacterium]
MAEKQQKVDRTVVRNQPLKRGSIGIRERHNERKNGSYANPDIVPERAPLNIHFKQCETTYEKALDGMIERGEVSTRGLKQDAHLFGEMVFDVNTAYFDRHGGYEYARQFFGEVYRFAEKEVDGRHILSAVMHADEKNVGFSEQLRRDVYQYHLHVVYLPVVEKEVRWTKRCRDPCLVGTVKEVIHQISHSKKWAFQTIQGENGEQKRVASYSLLQTRFFNHMREAGFQDFERGIEGSTAENLTAVEYKVQQETERLKATRTQALESEMWLDKVRDRLRQVEPVYREIQSVDGIGKKKRFSDKVELSSDEFDKLTGLAKFGIKAQATIENLESRLRKMTSKYNTLKTAFDKLKEETRPFVEAVREAPERVVNFLADVIQKANEERARQQFEAERQKEEMRKRRESPWRVRIDTPPQPKPRIRERGYDRER